jgi:hypothetical protein
MISQDIMQAACELLWAKANELKVNLKSIAVITPSDLNMFPYQLPDGILTACSSHFVSNHSLILSGTPAVICVESGSQIMTSEGEHTMMRPLCNVRVVDMRDHIGHHILCTLTNTLEEPPLKQGVSLFLYKSSYFTDVNQVALTSPCGFCGCSGVPECIIRITVPSSGAPTRETGCKYNHLFRYGSVDSGLKNKPCCNLPLKCGLVTLCSLLNPASPHAKFLFSLSRPFGTTTWQHISWTTTISTLFLDSVRRECHC